MEFILGSIDSTECIINGVDSSKCTRKDNLITAIIPDSVSLQSGNSYTNVI